MIAVVVGTAAETWPDLVSLSAMDEAAVEATVVAVNAAGIYLPSFDHWASLHPECFWRRGGDTEQGWVQQRLRYLSYFERSADDYELWGPQDKRREGVFALRTRGKGSSGYFGVEVAKHLGADRIILCGVPMTPTRHMDSREPWEMANAHFKHWTREHEKGKLQGVRSMSGRTRDLLGAPTKEWLRAESFTGA